MNLDNQSLKYLYLDFIKLLDDYCWVSGGAITNLKIGYKPNDLDVCFQNKESQEKAYVKAKQLGYYLINAGPNFYKMRDSNGVRPNPEPIGYEDEALPKRTRPSHLDIIFISNTPRLTIKKFDFTINQCAIDSDGKFFCVDDFEKHIQDRKLVISGEHPNKFLPNKARLIIKNLNKGFTIDRDEIIKWFPDVPPNLNTSEDYIEWLVNYIRTA